MRSLAQAGGSLLLGGFPQTPHLPDGTVWKNTIPAGYAGHNCPGSHHHICLAIPVISWSPVLNNVASGALLTIFLELWGYT